MRAYRNLLLLGAAVLLAAGVGAYVWQRRLASEQAAQAAIRQEVVRRGTIAATVSATGFLEPRNHANLYFSTASILPIQDVNVVVGQTVQRGEVLACLDARDLELEVKRAEQALRAARLALAQLKAPPRPEDVTLAEANLSLAQAQLAVASQGNSPEAVQVAYLNLLAARSALNHTYKTMDIFLTQGDLGWLAKNILLQSQADQQVVDAKIADERFHAAQEPLPSGPTASAQAGVEQAGTMLEQLQEGARTEDLEIAQLQVDQAQSALEVARHNLAGALITAPFDGVVVAVNIQPGELTASGVPAIALADVGGFYMDVAVDEVDIAHVVLGQKVTVTLDALPDAPLTGQVERIALIAAENAGVVSYAVRVLLDPAQASVRSGMTATANIVVAEARDVVLVPNWAIRRDRETGLTYAGVLRNGVVEEVPVTLGLRSEAYSEVIGGIAENDVAAVDTTRERINLIGNGQ